VSASITTFDTDFELPTANITRVFPDKYSPGVNSDETEAFVDVECHTPSRQVLRSVSTSEILSFRPLTL